MKKTSNTLIIISTALIVISVVVSSIVTQYSALISTLATTVTAIIGAVALYIQFKKDKSVNRASFLIEFSKEFFETYDCKELYEQLDDITRGKKFIVNERTLPRAVRYLQWCEELASLVESGVLDIPSIDKFLSFRFFIVTNCKEIQELEILNSLEYYEGVVILHKKWTEWKRLHNKVIPLNETNLTDILKNKKIGK